jgi:hypothetical protein
MWYCLEWKNDVAVHLHQTDYEMDRAGEGTADIVCHLCRQAWTVRYPPDASLEELVRMFAASHNHPRSDAPCSTSLAIERYLDMISQGAVPV